MNIAKTLALRDTSSYILNGFFSTFSFISLPTMTSVGGRRRSALLSAPL